MISRLPAIVVAVVSIVTLCAASQAADKKLIRIAHPAADDVDTDQQMFAWSFGMPPFFGHLACQAFRISLSPKYAIAGLM
jgi:hypothetical protein